MKRASSRSLAHVLAAVLLAGCSNYQQQVAPLAIEALHASVPLALETAMEEPFVPTAPPLTHRRGMAALKGVGYSVAGGAWGGAMTADPFGLALGIALGVAAAPFVALGSAIAAPASAEVPDSAREISGAITRTRWDLALKDAVESALAKRGKSVTAAPSPDADRLRLTVEGPWLVLDSYTGVPTLTVHGELARARTCLLDRRWRWNGEGDHFVDLGEEWATEYRLQMEQGVGLLADAIASDLLGSATPRKTAYRDEASAAGGGRPLVVTNPMGFQEQIGSWDKTESEAAREPRCSGILSAVPVAPMLPPHDDCRGAGCRNL